MLRVTHTGCGHSWMQVILPEGVTEVRDCSLCEAERELGAQRVMENFRQEERDKARYYHNKYGDEM